MLIIQLKDNSFFHSFEKQGENQIMRTTFVAKSAKNYKHMGHQELSNDYGQLKNSRQEPKAMVYDSETTQLESFSRNSL